MNAMKKVVIGNDIQNIVKYICRNPEKHLQGMQATLQHISTKVIVMTKRLVMKDFTYVLNMDHIY